MNLNSNYGWFCLFDNFKFRYIFQSFVLATSIEKSTFTNFLFFVQTRTVNQLFSFFISISFPSAYKDIEKKDNNNNDNVALIIYIFNVIDAKLNICHKGDSFFCSQNVHNRFVNIL